MAERYSKIFALKERLYATGAPVIIAAGALLKDSQTGNVVAQLKLTNKCPKGIKAARVLVYPLDAFGRQLGEAVSYDYLDIRVKRDDSFGQKNAIILPDAATRAFRAAVTEVAFTDSSLWTSEGGAWEPLPWQDSLQTYLREDELQKQYRIRFGQKASFKPMILSGIWLCTCGAVNDAEEETCHACGDRLTDLLACDLKSLADEKDHRLAGEKAAREKKEAEEKAAREKRAAEKKAAAEAAAKKIKRILSIAIPLVLIAAILAVSGTLLLQRKHRVDEAMALIAAEDYETGYAQLEEMGLHGRVVKNLRERAAELLAAGDLEAAYALYEQSGDYDLIEADKKAREEAAQSTLQENGQAAPEEADRDNLDASSAKPLSASADVGDNILFGSYEQDNDLENGAEPIEWIVLAREDGRILVLSRYALDCKPFNETAEKVTWKTCTLRTWLNDDFMKTAFGADEQAMIPIVTVNGTIAKYGSSSEALAPENNSEDRVFLLSNTERLTYGKMNCLPTAYAKAKGAVIDDNNANGWWLRCTVEGMSQASYIGYLKEGSHSNLHQAAVWNKQNAVRPAMWIDLSGLGQGTAAGTASGRLSAEELKELIRTSGIEAAIPYLEEQNALYANHILLMTIDPSTGTALDSGTIAWKAGLAEQLASELRDIKNPQERISRFLALKDQYDEDVGKVHNPYGYLFYPGAMPAAFEEACRELAVYGVSSPVTSDYGYHIILRLPLEDYQEGAALPQG